MDTMLDLYSSILTALDDIKINKEPKQREKLIDNDKVVMADFKVVE